MPLFWGNSQLGAPKQGVVWKKKFTAIGGFSAIMREIFIPQYPSKFFAARSCQYGHFKPMADSVRLLELKLEIKNRFSKMAYFKKTDPYV